MSLVGRNACRARNVDFLEYDCVIGMACPNLYWATRGLSSFAQFTGPALVPETEQGCTSHTLPSALTLPTPIQLHAPPVAPPRAGIFSTLIPAMSTVSYPLVDDGIDSDDHLEELLPATTEFLQPGEHGGLFSSLDARHVAGARSLSFHSCPVLPRRH